MNMLCIVHPLGARALPNRLQSITEFEMYTRQQPLGCEDASEQQAQSRTGSTVLLFPSPLPLPLPEMEFVFITQVACNDVSH